MEYKETRGNTEAQQGVKIEQGNTMLPTPGPQKEPPVFSRGFPCVLCMGICFDHRIIDFFSKFSSRNGILKCKVSIL